MINDPAMQELGVSPVTAHQCTYNGEQWCKPTWVWTRLYPDYWQPRNPSEYCRWCRTNTKHPVKIVRRDKDDTRDSPAIPGFNGKAAKNRIHPDLAEEWVMAAKKWRQDHL